MSYHGVTRVECDGDGILLLFQQPHLEPVAVFPMGAWQRFETPERLLLPPAPTPTATALREELRKEVDDLVQRARLAALEEVQTIVNNMLVTPEDILRLRTWLDRQLERK